MTISNRLIVAPLASALIAAAAAGCGGSSSSSSGASQTTSQHSVTTVTFTPASPKSRAGAAKKQRAEHTGKPKLHAEHAGKSKLHATVYNPNPPGTRGGGAGPAPIAKIPSSAQNPCTLVTAAEAQAIVHAPVLRQTEASQGPTCLLELKGGPRSITLAVQAVNVSREIAQMEKKPTQLSIGGHKAYCGTLGSQLLFVELGGGRVLQVAAPCGTAQALATKALPRIKA